MSTQPRPERASKKRPPRPKKNPIEAAITTWHDGLSPHLKESHDLQRLLAEAPKRWTAYGPLVLLPTGSFTSSAWKAILEPQVNSDDQTESSKQNETPDQNEKQEGIHEAAKTLWPSLLSQINPSSTHLAINEGIPLHSKDSSSTSNKENILRSPSGLRMIQGSFGPSTTSTPPSAHDFTAAFWVSTKQNSLTQVWAPRWTMFSRGNITEKARVLTFGSGTGKIAVDLYAGIGYFAFSYAKLGFRVLCWELNPWSVEGLRRGAVANGWGVRVIRSVDDGVLREVLDGDERLVVFLEDNRRAAERVRRLDELAGEGREWRMRDVRHVNMGLLPTCRDAWETAWEVVAETREVRLHLHENVGVADVEAKKGEIEEWFKSRAGRGTRVWVEHVEMVKTFAPGVWHCVYDLCVEREAEDAGLVDELSQKTLT